MLIDDFFPVDDPDPDCAFCASGAIWPALLEKALAKANGGYPSLHHLSPATILQSLTSAPSLTLNFTDISPVLLLEKSGKWPMVVTKDGNHYAVIKIQRVLKEDENEGEDNLVTYMKIKGIAGVKKPKLSF